MTRARPDDARRRFRACRHRAAAGLALTVGLLLAACSSPVRELPVAPATPEPEPWCCTAGAEPVRLEYLGVGGWLIGVGDAAILTAPLFSNPGLVEVGLERLRPDTATIDAHLPPVEEVQAILVGHAHYDHLMDVPYILRRRAPEARMYGSRTAVNLVRGDPELDPDRLVPVEARAGTHEASGEWFHTPDGRFRFMPLISGHAPHFMGITLYAGQVEAPRDSLPARAVDWVEGTPLAYLIDVLSPEGEVVYRIHYQDAASEPPDGFPPPLEDGIPVNLAIVCPPGYSEVDGYPDGILERVAPQGVLLGHWEDFFRPRSDPLQAVPATDLEDFIRRMEAVLPPAVRWAMPEPGWKATVGSGLTNEPRDPASSSRSGAPRPPSRRPA